MMASFERRPVVAGALLGLVWAISMRAWMRFITTDPEFSWTATGFILGASVLVGGVLGFARKRRLAGGVGWWRLSLVSLVLLGAGGSVMWPTVILGAAAIGLRRPTWLRVLLGSGAVAAQINVVQDSILHYAPLLAVKSMVAVVWYAPMLFVEIWAFSVVFSPAVESATVPGRLKKVLIAVPMAAMAAFAVVATGMTGM